MRLTLRLLSSVSLGAFAASGVASPNTPPVASNDSVNVPEDTPTTFAVLANDLDADGNTLSVSSVTQGAHGHVARNVDDTITYTPNPDYNGPDVFTYTANDGVGGVDTASVSVTVLSVNDNPVSVGDALTIDQDTIGVVDVLSNDTDTENDPLSVSSVTQGANGTVSINPDNTVQYIPSSGFFGADSFTYTVSDGNGGSDTGAVAVTVNEVVTEPPATGDPEAGLFPGSTVSLTAPVNVAFLPTDWPVGVVSSPVVMAADLVGLDGSTGGLIYESGGPGNGMVVGFYSDGRFYVRLSGGTAEWETGTTYLIVPAANAPSGDGTLVWAVDDGPYFRLRVWWNGVLLTGTSQRMTTLGVSSGLNQWTGGNDGIYLPVSGHGGTVMPEGPYTLGSPSYTSASDLRVYFARQTSVGDGSDLVNPSIESDMAMTLSRGPGEVLEMVNTELTDRDSDVTIAAEFVGLDGSSGGMIAEFGASGNGAWAGFYADGRFMVRCGDGAGEWQPDTSYLIVPAANAPSGDGTLIVNIYDGPRFAIRAWWNGQELIGTSTRATVDPNNGQWAGTDDGTYMSNAVTTVTDAPFITPVPVTSASRMRAYFRQSPVT